MLPQLNNYILENWKNLFPYLNKAQKINYIGISGSVEGATTTFLAFSDKDKKPIFVVRVLRNPNKTELIINERDALLFLSSLGAFIKESVPKLIICEKFARTWVLVESVLEGKPMKVIIGSAGIPEPKNTNTNMRLIIDWLIKFNNETKSNLILTSAMFDQYILRKIEEFQKIFLISKDEREHLSQLINIFESTLPHGIPLFFRHGDFCKHNILIHEYRSQCKLRVIDWVFSQRYSLPFYDILLFVTTYFLQFRRQSGISGYYKNFRDTFFDKNSYSEIMLSGLKEYFHEVNIDLALAQSFFSLFLLERALSEYHDLSSLSHRGFIPGYGIYLNSNKNAKYHDALKNQMWIHFFHIFVKEQKYFIIK